MIKVERFIIPACCGQITTVFRIDRPITQSLLNKLIEHGFKEQSHFTKAGILYADNKALILTGPFGSDRLQIRCKIKDCEQKLNEFEEVLLKLE
jgi:hypothetical protein